MFLLSVLGNALDSPPAMPAAVPSEAVSPSPREVTAELKSQANSPQVLQRKIVLMLLSQTFLVLATLRASRFFGDEPADVLALDPPRGGKRIYVEAFIGMIGVVVICNLLSSIFSPGGFTNDLKPFVGLIRSDFWWVTVLVVGIGAPLSEELLFRGFLFSSLARSRAGIGGAAALTTAIWTMLHSDYSAPGMIEVGIIGLYFSWLLYRTGSLRVTIFCHAVYNSMLILALALVPLPA